MRKGGLVADHHEFLDDGPKAGDAEAEVKELEAEKDRLERVLNDIATDEAARRKAEQLKTEIEQLEAEIDQHRSTRKE